MVDLLLGQKAGQGLCISFESDFVDLVQSLPRPPGGDGIFYVHTWSSHGMRTGSEASASTHIPDPSSNQPAVSNAPNLDPPPNQSPPNQPPLSTTDAALPASFLHQPRNLPPQSQSPLIPRLVQVQHDPSFQTPLLHPPTVQPSVQALQADAALPISGSSSPRRPLLPDRRPKNHRVRSIYILAAATWLCRCNPFYADCRLDLQAVEGHRVEGERQDAMDVDSPVEEDAVEVLSLEEMQHGVSLAADPNIRLGAGAEALGVAGGGTNAERHRQQRELRESRASLHFKMKRANGLPVSFFTREGIEALSFPCKFPDGLNHWGFNRPTKLQLGMYFRNRIQGEDKRFACDPLYICWALSVFHTSQLRGVVDVALRQWTGNFTRTEVAEAVVNNEVSERSIHKPTEKTWAFMKNIRGTAAYWQDAKSDVFAMIRSLGPPTFFMTLSANDMGWDDLMIVLKQRRDGEVMSDDDMAAYLETLDKEERRKLFLKDQPAAALHFAHRWEALLEWIKTDPSRPLGEVEDIFWRVEFQQRGEQF